MLSLEEMDYLYGSTARPWNVIGHCEEDTESSQL